MSMLDYAEQCTCGADDCPQCHPENCYYYEDEEEEYQGEEDEYI